MSSTKISNKGWFRVFIVIPAFFIFTVVFQVLALGISFFLSGTGLIEEFTLDQLDSFDNLPVMTIIQYVDMVGIFLLLWIFMKFIDKEPFMNMGFSIKGKRNDIILGMTLGLFMMAFGYFVLESLGEIQFSRINYDLSSIIWLFILFIGVSVLEETFVRGYVLKNLLKSFNPIVSLVVSSALFSLLHFFNPNVNLTCESGRGEGIQRPGKRFIPGNYPYIKKCLKHNTTLLNQYESKELTDIPCDGMNMDCYYMLFRGNQGGYVLNKKMKEIKLTNIFDAVDEKVKTVQCKKESKKGCNGKLTKCVTHNLWDELESHINNFFEQKTLEDLVKEKNEKRI